MAMQVIFRCITTSSELNILRLLVKDGARSMDHGARSTEHGARSTRKIEILYEKKYSHFTNLLHILSLLITNFSLLRVRKIGYYPYIRGIIFYTF